MNNQMRPMNNQSMGMGGMNNQSMGMNNQGMGLEEMLYDESWVVKDIIPEESFDDDSNISNNKAGAFIGEYILWRVSRINRNPYVTKQHIDPGFIKEPVTSQFFKILDKSEKLLQNVLNYYQSDKGLILMGISRPELDEDLKEFVTDINSKKIYTEYATLVLLKSLHSQALEKKEPSLVVIDKVNKRLKHVTTNTLVSKHSMMMTFIAVESKAQNLLGYLFQTQTDIPILKKQILDETFITEWIQTAIKEQQDNKDDKDYDNYRFNDLKFKLDFLDPTFALSNEIISQYYSRILTFYAASSIKDCKLTKDILLAAIQKQFKEVEVKGELSSIVKLIKSICGSLNTFCAKLTNEILKTSISRQHKLKYDAEYVFTLDKSSLIKTMRKGMEKSKENDLIKLFVDNNNFVKLANSLMVCAQASCIFYSIKNWSNLEVFKKGLFDNTPSLSVIDIHNSAIDNRLFFKIGYVIKKWVINNPWKTVALGLTKSFKYISNASKSITKFVAPTLTFISICSTAYDMWDNIPKQNWGILVANVSELSKEFTYIGDLLKLLFSTTTWAGPVSLILSGILMPNIYTNLLFGSFGDLGDNGDPRLSNFLYFCDQGLLVDKVIYYYKMLIIALKSGGTRDPRYQQISMYLQFYSKDKYIELLTKALKIASK